MTYQFQEDGLCVFEVGGKASGHTLHVSITESHIRGGNFIR
jgi:hypothetical protein